MSSPKTSRRVSRPLSSFFLKRAERQHEKNRLATDESLERIREYCARRTGVSVQ